MADDRLKGVREALRQLDEHDLERSAQRKRKADKLKALATKNASAGRRAASKAALRSPSQRSLRLAERALCLELLREQHPTVSDEELEAHLREFGG